MNRVRLNLANVVKGIALVLVPLILWRFYWYVGLNHDRTALLSFLLSAGLILYLVFLFISGRLQRISGKSVYSNYLIALIIIAFISWINAALYWNQTFSLTFRAGNSVFVVIYFFILYTTNITNSGITRLVFFFSILYFFLWTYAVSQAPQVVFGNLEEINEDRGFARITNMKSIDLVYLLYFISLVKVSIKGQTNRVLWLPILIVAFVLIIYSLSRMVILSALLMTVIYLFRNKPLYLFVSIIAVFAFSSYIIDSPVIASLLELTEEEVNSQSRSALRIVEYTQFMDIYPFKIGTFLFGNGAPHVDSSYGIFEESVKSMFRFHRSDAGYVGMYLTYGVTSIIILVSLVVKVIKQKVSQDAMPYKLFVIFLFMINITSWEFFTCGIGFMIALYMLDKDSQSLLEANPTRILKPDV